jgi:hypothetical protein
MPLAAVRYAKATRPAPEFRKKSVLARATFFLSESNRYARRNADTSPSKTSAIKWLI